VVPNRGGMHDPCPTRLPLENGGGAGTSSLNAALGSHVTCAAITFRHAWLYEHLSDGINLLWGVVALVSANEKKLVITLTKCPPLRDTASLYQELGYIPGDTCQCTIQLVTIFV